MSSILFDPPFIAHRGMSQRAPENTLAALKALVQTKIKWVEFDVMLSKDHIPVVIHDETLHRTTTGYGNVFDHSFEDLQKCDAGSWFASQFANEKIPSLEEAFVFLQKYNLSVNVEVKARVGNEALEAKKIVTEAKRFWQSSSDQIIFSSFSILILQNIRELLPDANISLLVHNWFDDWEQCALNLNCISVNVNHEVLEKSHIDTIKSMQKKVLAYTINDVLRAQELFDMGVDAIFSDCPDVLYEELK